MKKMTYMEIRGKYLEFLKKHGHIEIPSASLVPENDPTLLFVSAGMVPLVPFLLGETHPKGKRLTNSQRCVRTIDIDDVGDTSHCTSFEMLGNWSLNDYFKDEAIRISVEFFVKVMGFEMDKMYASVFEGNDDAPLDQESVNVWKKVFKEYGIDAKVGKGERIQPLGKKENWWELAGGGPCGPNSEFFYDVGKPKCGPDCDVSCNCGKYIELGNNVFMEFLKEGEKYSPLGRHNVDFGGGLDRYAMISQQVESVFETDIYKPIYEKIKQLSKNDIIESQRIITDHIKAATWMIMDGVVPGRTEREYILRRLIRRAIRHGKKLGIEEKFCGQVAQVAIDQFSVVWPMLKEKEKEIIQTIEEEEQKFNQTLNQGLKEVEKLVQQIGQKDFDNKDGVSFKIFETYGFPPEMLIEELSNRNIKVDEDLFWKNHEEAFEKHQKKSRTATKGLFKGGLADTSDQSKKLHTATHLLLRALYEVIGDHVYQKGSSITPERLRLDFPNEEKLTPEQLQQVEDWVNDKIQKQLPVSYEEMPKEKALELAPYPVFEDRYPDVVKMYYIGDKSDPVSLEICNGPHVENTSELGKFKITKQENVGAGIKRIKAVLE